VTDLGWDAVVPRGQEMDPPGPGDHDAHGRERVGAGAPQCARPRGVTHVARPAEHQHVEAGALHDGEQTAAALQTQPREADVVGVLERHHAGHAATSKGS